MARIEEPVDRITVTRTGNWYLVAFDGVTVWRRLTRDPAFTKVEIRFYHRQPGEVSHRPCDLSGVSLRGPWRSVDRYSGGDVVSCDLPKDGDTVTLVRQVIKDSFFTDKDKNTYVVDQVKPPEPSLSIRRSTIPWSELASFGADEDPWPPF